MVDPLCTIYLTERTIIDVKPTFDPNREFNASQKQHQEAFKQAAAYAKSARNEEVYVEKADGTPKSSYNVAVADWFHEPEILEIDINGWNGQAGQPIRIKAQDDIQVIKVSVVISDEQGTVLEQGNAAPENGLWWTYMTTASASGNSHIQATAQDLPGNITEMAYQN